MPEVFQRWRRGGFAVCGLVLAVALAGLVLAAGLERSPIRLGAIPATANLPAAGGMPGGMRYGWRRGLVQGDWIRSTGPDHALQAAVDEAARGRDTIVLVEDLASGQVAAQHHGALAGRLRLLPGSALVNGLRGFGLAPDVPESATADVGAMAIGAEAVHVTPAQLLAAYAGLLRQGATDADAAVVREGMRQCVQRGTGAAAAAPGRSVAGRIFAAMRTEKSDEAAVPAGARLLPVAQQRQDPPASPGIRRLAERPIRLELDTRHILRALRLSSSQPFTLTGGKSPITLRGPLQLLWTESGLALKNAAGEQKWGGRAVSVSSASPFTIMITGAAGSQRLALSGRLEVRRMPHALRLIAEMPLEEYVAGAVSAEAGDMPPAAERAMAVLVRTWALENRGRHRRQGFDFCSTTHCQDWKMHRPLAGAVAATRRTQGQVLEYRGRLATIFYSADCGGVTAPGSQFGNGARLPYLASHPDPWCRWSPQTNWTTVIPRAELAALMVKAGWLHHPPAHLELRVLRRDQSGRALTLTVSGASIHVIRAPAFLFLIDRHLGWNRIKSTLFKIVDEGDAIRFAGHGLGHGAGLCQDGAEGMARAGRDERQILAFYFPGTVIARLNLPTGQTDTVKKASSRISAPAFLQPAPHLVETAWTPTPSPSRALCLRWPLPPALSGRDAAGGARPLRRYDP